MCYTRRKNEGGVGALRESDDTKFLKPNGQSKNLNVYGCAIGKLFMVFGESLLYHHQALWHCTSASSEKDNLLLCDFSPHQYKIIVIRLKIINSISRLRLCYSVTHLYIYSIIEIHRKSHAISKFFKHKSAVARFARNNILVAQQLNQRGNIWIQKWKYIVLSSRRG